MNTLKHPEKCKLCGQLKGVTAEHISPNAMLMEFKD